MPLEPDAHFCPHCAHPVGGVAGVEPAAAPPSTPGAETATGAGSSVQPAGPDGATAQRKRRNLLLYAVALILVVGLAIGITLFFTRSSRESGELFLESATSTGANPFTDSTATGTGTPGTTTTPAPTSAGPTTAEGQTVVGTVNGSTAGLYGGTLNEASCDREEQITFLQANPEKAAAFAAVLGIATDQIPDYLRGLTPLVLRHDTRVTNHGFVDGTATSFQSVLQAGTAVLVDKHGIPRVRCLCGNPLMPPTAIEGDVRYRGETWPGFVLNQTIVINNNVDINIELFILVDTLTGDWFDRPTGTDGSLDKPHDGGGGTTTGGGGGLALCADTYEGAVNRILGFRRNNDRAGASVCGSPVVLDYLWRLSDDFVGTLRIDHCEEGNKGQLPPNIQGYACSMSNNAIFVVELVPQGPRNWIVTYVALVDGRTSTTGTPPAAESGCGSSGESFSPQTSDDRTLVNYFTAINAKDYGPAWNLLGDRLQSEYGSQQAFADQMAQHVSCVRVLDITPIGNQEYRLQFAAQYTTPFPAGSGQLPTFWTVSGGKIVSSGTGP